MNLHPPRPPLFPYTTLFRSVRRAGEEEGRAGDAPAGGGDRAPEDARPDGGRPRAGREDGRGHGPQPRPRRGLGTTHGEAKQARSEEHTSELQSLTNLVCRLL